MLEEAFGGGESQPTSLQPDTTPAVYDAATLAVLAAMEEAAEKHLDAIRPHNTKRGYANDRAGIVLCSVG